MPRFLPNIYQHKEVPEDAIREILEDLPKSFTVDMNISLSKEIMENEFFWPFTQWPKGKLRDMTEYLWSFSKSIGQLLARVFTLW